MCRKVVVPVCFDAKFLNIVDEQIIKEYGKRKHGRKFNRSEFISEALDYYLKVKCGIPYIIGRAK